VLSVDEPKHAEDFRDPVHALLLEPSRHQAILTFCTVRWRPQLEQ
jgi:hypothetical protein